MNNVSGLALFAVMLAFTVVILGAYTRLTDAGLGCPDWPGCYGHVMVPQDSVTMNQVQQSFPGVHIEKRKAWTEMVHRYLAGTLGLVIAFLAGLSLVGRKKVNYPLVIPFLLIGLVVFQAVLGMWTVTLKLFPPVVMGHLLGGLSILSLLWLFFLFAKEKQLTDSLHFEKNYHPWAMIGLFIVFVQLTLGGWVSSNYAALICPDFPYCQGQWLPHLDFKTAFNFFTPIGINYQGGVLGNTARVTIHMAHRIGAVLTALYVLWLAIRLVRFEKEKVLRTLGYVMGAIVLTQFTLGILNVKWLLPLPVAVAHNGVAGLLLLSVITLNYLTYKN